MWSWNKNNRFNPMLSNYGNGTLGHKNKTTSKYCMKCLMQTIISNIQNNFLKFMVKEKGEVSKVITLIKNKFEWRCFWKYWLPQLHSTRMYPSTLYIIYACTHVHCIILIHCIFKSWICSTLVLCKVAPTMWMTDFLAICCVDSACRSIKFKYTVTSSNNRQILCNVCIKMSKECLFCRRSLSSIIMLVKFS